MADGNDTRIGPMPSPAGGAPVLRTAAAVTPLAAEPPAEMPPPTAPPPIAAAAAAPLAGCPPVAMPPPTPPGAQTPPHPFGTAYDESLPGSLHRFQEYWKPVTAAVVTLITITSAVVMAYASRASVADLNTAKATLDDVSHTTKEIKDKLEQLDKNHAENSARLQRDIESVGKEIRDRLDSMKDRFGDLQKEVGKLSGAVDSGTRSAADRARKLHGE